MRQFFRSSYDLANAAPLAPIGKVNVKALRSLLTKKAAQYEA